MSNRSKHQQRIDQCMVGWSQELPAIPTMPDEKVRILRARLIMEECLETINKGLGVQVCFMFGEERLTGGGFYVGMEGLRFPADLEPDLVELADGCADISVVTIGTLSAAGIADKPLLKEVDKNNLLKIETGHLNPVTGKFEKHRDHPTPDIAGVLEAQILGEAEDEGCIAAGFTCRQPTVAGFRYCKEHYYPDSVPQEDLAQETDVLRDRRPETFEESVDRIDKLLGLVGLGVSPRTLSELKAAWEARPVTCVTLEKPTDEDVHESLKQKESLVGASIRCGKSWCSASMPCAECSGADRKLF